MMEIPDGNNACLYCGYVRGTLAREAYHMAPESILHKRYIVGRVLGFGGFGVTYIGYDAQLDRVVAIKEFLPTTFSTRMPGNTAITVYEGEASRQFSYGLDRFIDEAQRLAQFNGIAGITDIYDTFWENNTAYIIMQYLKGKDAKVVLTSEGPMPYERARDIILCICDALMPVHAKGIIHRDISPDNIFLTDDGQVKLLDFGAARYQSGVNSKSLSVILKAGYAPEEQYRSRGEQGSWTDVYALSATFYKLLTGVTPPDSMERAINDELKEPSKLGAELPQSAENAILNAMNIRGANRTQTVDAFKQQLLADGVERIKEKPRKVSTRKFPVPAIVAIALSAVLLTTFLILQLTGAVDNIIGDSRRLGSNFGSVVADGYAIVPGLTGRSADEARAILDDLGLVYEDSGIWEFNNTVPRGVVISQEPPAGRQLAVGETVLVNVSLGSLLDAISDGVIPNPVGMTGAECVGFSQLLREARIWVQYKYEYSNTVPAGIVTDFSHTPGEHGIIIYISAGPDNGAPPYGTPRAPLLSTSYGDISAHITAASATFYDQDRPDDRFMTEWDIQVSRDRTSWTSLISRGGYSHIQYHLQEDERERGNIAPRNQMNLSDSIFNMIINGELTNGTLYLRARQLWNDWNTQASDEERFLSSIDFTQVLDINITPTVIDIYNIEMLEWEDVEDVVSNDRGHYWDLRHAMEERRDEHIPIKVTGNFKKETHYRFVITDSSNRYSPYARGIYIIDEGEFYIPVQLPWSGAAGTFTLLIYEEVEVLSNEDGSRITYTIDRPATAVFAAHRSDNSELPVRGMEPAKAYEAIKDFTGLQNDHNISIGFTHSMTVPPGKTVTWSGNPQDGIYHWVELWISLGSVDDDPSLVPVFGVSDTSRYHESPYDLPIFGFSLGRFEELTYRIEYQGNNNNEWHSLGGSHIRREWSSKNIIQPSYWGIPDNLSGLRFRFRLYHTDEYGAPVGQEIYSLVLDVPRR